MKKLPLIAPVPSLPSHLNNLYQSLTIDNKRLFVRVFRFLWDYLLPMRHFTASNSVLYYYWAVDLFRVRSGLSPVLFASLTYLYYITDKGKKVITSEQFYNGVGVSYWGQISKPKILYILRTLGYVTRSTRNPQDPYYKRAYRRQAVFISLTPSAVSLIEGIEHDLYYLLVRSSLDELTGNKKPDKC